jgi:hypothetical protein
MGYHDEWVDLNHDGVIDTHLIDLNGDGHWDVQYTDTNGDGHADVMLVDTNGDGRADAQAYEDGSGVIHSAIDLNGDGHADVIYQAGPFPTEHSHHASTHSTSTHTGTQHHSSGGTTTSHHTVPAEHHTQQVTHSAPAPVPAPVVSAPSVPAVHATVSAPVPAVAAVPAVPAVPGLTGDTAAVLASVNGQMRDAGLIYHAALNPSSVSASQLSAAETRASWAAQNAESMAGDAYVTGIYNSVLTDEANQRASEAAEENATSVYIDASNAEDEASWAL